MYVFGQQLSKSMPHFLFMRRITFFCRKRKILNYWRMFSPISYYHTSLMMRGMESLTEPLTNSMQVFILNEILKCVNQWNEVCFSGLDCGVMTNHIMQEMLCSCKIDSSSWEQLQEQGVRIPAWYRRCWPSAGASWPFCFFLISNFITVLENGV